VFLSCTERRSKAERQIERKKESVFMLHRKRERDKNRKMDREKERE